MGGCAGAARPFPFVIAGRADAVLAANFLDRHAGFRLIQDRDDLSFCKFRLSHLTSPLGLIVPKFHFGVVYLAGKLTVLLAL